MNVQIVSFHCVLKNRLGRVLSSTFNQDVLTWDEDQKEVLSGLAKGLQNIQKGEKRKITLSAEEAYGYYDPSKVIEMSRSEVPREKTLKVGDPVVFMKKESGPVTYRVAQLSQDTVILDANHPLAGQDLVFEVEAVAARQATPEEISGSNEPAPRMWLH